MGGGDLLINLPCLLLMALETGPCSCEATALSATPPRRQGSTGFVTFSICSFQVLLNRNITVLLEVLEESRQAEANLTLKLRLEEGREKLQRSHERRRSPHATTALFLARFSPLLP